MVWRCTVHLALTMATFGPCTLDLALAVVIFWLCTVNLALTTVSFWLAGKKQSQRSDRCPVANSRPPSIACCLQHTRGSFHPLLPAEALGSLSWAEQEPESCNRGWDGPLEVIWSQLPAEAGSLKQLHSKASRRVWIHPEEETSPLWALCARAPLPSCHVLPHRVHSDSSNYLPTLIVWPVMVPSGDLPVLIDHRALFHRIFSPFPWEWGVSGVLQFSFTSW